MNTTCIEGLDSIVKKRVVSIFCEANKSHGSNGTYKDSYQSNLYLIFHVKSRIRYKCNSYVHWL